jgi:hypothetical protein
MYRQWKSMQGQLAQMEASGKQSEELVKHTEHQAEVLMAQTEATQLLVRATIQGVEVSQKSADAALLNANSLKNAERSWVDAEIVRPSGIPSTAYLLNVTNHGKSPAVILSFKYARHGYVSMKDIPQERFDGAHGVWTQHSINQILPVGARHTIFEFDIREWKDDLSRSQIPIHRAVVSYRDIFGDEHETEVVYRYDGEKLGLAHLRRYNRLT